MFTRFSCEAMLYFDSKRRMWLNDTTQFIYISGKCKFAHNKPQITVQQLRQDIPPQLWFQPAHISPGYFLLEVLSVFTHTHMLLHIVISFSCCSKPGDVHHQNFPLCVSEQSYGNGVKGNPMCRNSGKIHIGRHEVLILRRCQKSIASAYNIKYLMG